MTAVAQSSLTPLAERLLAALAAPGLLLGTLVYRCLRG